MLKTTAYNLEFSRQFVKQAKQSDGASILKNNFLLCW